MGLYKQILILQGLLDEMDLVKDAEGQVGSRKYNYLTLDKLHRAVIPRLGALGLVWLTFPTSTGEGKPALAYSLRHVESDEEIGDTMPLLLSDETSQGLGSAITYARRYCLAAVLGLTPDEDDDGAAASASPASPTRQQPSRAATVTVSRAQESVKPASVKQRGLIHARASEKGLPPSGLANIVGKAIGEEWGFDDDVKAQEWLKRRMDRLPWTAVNPVLEGIEKATVNSI
jgi:hypothetical protein